MDKRSISFFPRWGCKAEQDIGTDGVKATEDQTSGLNVDNTATSVTETTGNDSSYMQYKNHQLCDKGEELSSRDIFTCVHNEDYTGFCEKIST